MIKITKCLYNAEALPVDERFIWINPLTIVTLERVQACLTPPYVPGRERIDLMRSATAVTLVTGKSFCCNETPEKILGLIYPPESV